MVGNWEVNPKTSTVLAGAQLAATLKSSDNDD